MNLKRFLIVTIILVTILCMFITPVQAKEKYHTARVVWNTLDKHHFNDYVKAGIIGNMMSECGGYTLNLKWNLRYGQYYGLCQWAKKYYSSVHGASLNSQISYLMKTMKKEFNVFGRRYRSGFKYESFKKLKNERDAALAFAKCYERCSSKGYSTRQRNATIALNYFK